MKIDKFFNQMQKEEYFYFIKNCKKYSNFNILGLYRSLLENNSLTLKDRLEIRDFTNIYFQKTFNFLQLKDSITYFKLSYLGQELTSADELRAWEIIWQNQEKILKDKKIKHRNFGSYSIHNCGIETCVYNGLMIKQNSFNCENTMRFKSDKNKYAKKLKARRLAKEQRKFKINKNSFLI